MKFQKLLIIVPVMALLAAPFLSYAQFSEQTFVTNVTDISGVYGVIENIAQWFLTIIVAVSVIMFVYAGFLYLTSGGDDDKVKKAKDYLLYGIIGVAVALLAAAITNVVIYLAGQAG